MDRNECVSSYCLFSWIVKFVLELSKSSRRPLRAVTVNGGMKMPAWFVPISFFRCFSITFPLE